jgi:hypothetical protein
LLFFFFFNTYVMNVFTLQYGVIITLTIHGFLRLVISKFIHWDKIMIAIAFGSYSPTVNECDNAAVPKLLSPEPEKNKKWDYCDSPAIKSYVDIRGSYNSHSAFYQTFESFHCLGRAKRKYVYRIFIRTTHVKLFGLSKGGELFANRCNVATHRIVSLRIPRISSYYRNISRNNW